LLLTCQRRDQFAGPVSITHFFTLLFFAAPESFLSLAAVIHAESAAWANEAANAALIAQKPESFAAGEHVVLNPRTGKAWTLPSGSRRIGIDGSRMITHSNGRAAI
jgi:hypothetical protein